MKTLNWKRGQPNRSLKNLRDILGMTQQEFAELVGVSIDTIGSIELGRMALTRLMAQRIKVATGADLMTVVLKKNRAHWKPLAGGQVGFFLALEEYLNDPGADAEFLRLMRQPYSRAHFDYHRKFYRTDPAAAEMALAEILPALRRLFQSATKAGTGCKLPALRQSFWNWLGEQRAAFRLGPPPV